MVVVVSAGQSGDSPMLPVLLDHLSVPRIGPGRPRTTPDRLRGDKAYSARGHRSLLRSRGITTTIPEPADQIANRHAEGNMPCVNQQPGRRRSQRVAAAGDNTDKHKL